MDRLIPCCSCARHVKATEPRCPFCGEPVDAKASPVTQPYNRMVAAAAVATSVATLIGCGGSATGSSGTVFYGAANIVDASPGDEPSAVAFYGTVNPYPYDATAPVDATSSDATAPADATSNDATNKADAPGDSSVEDSPSVIAFYGTVRPPDAGSEQG
jgi:hypothetical protein